MHLVEAAMPDRSKRDSEVRPITIAERRFAEEAAALSELSIEERFARIYQTNLWFDAESRSGTGSNLDETAQLRASLQEARALTSLGARPLVVVTAVLEAPAGWVPAQDGLVSLSTNSVHRVMQDLSHAPLITSESGATASSKAILDVVAAVRTGARVAN